MPGCLVPGAPGVVCCGVGAGSASPLVRVSPLAGFRPVSALIWSVFEGNPANTEGVGRGQNEGVMAGVRLGRRSLTIVGVSLDVPVGSWPVVLHGPLTL